MGISYDEVFSKIKLLCVKTLMAVEPSINTAMRTVKHKNQCFEVYGFDVMVDAKLRPWLLEVNVAPSLSSSSPYDKQVKCKLLCDTLHMVGFRAFDQLFRIAITQVGSPAAGARISSAGTVCEDLNQRLRSRRERHPVPLAPWSGREGNGSPGRTT